MYLKTISKLCLCVVITLYGTIMNLYSQKKIITPEVLYSMEQLSNATVSPDGKFVLLSVSKPNIETNKMESSTQIISINGEVQNIFKEENATISSPIWNSNGDALAYILSKGTEHHIYIARIKSENNELAFYSLPTRIASFEETISNLKFSPDGKYIAFIKDVKIDKTVEEKYPQYPKANVRIYNSLPIRQWDVWIDENVSHIFYMPINGAATDAKDIMTGEKYRLINGFDWSPDSKEIAYSCKKVIGVEAARSTNSDIYVYNLVNENVNNITDGMKGYDNFPVYSPDGKYIAFRSQERAGFESDRIRVMLYDRTARTISELTTNFDQWVEECIWSPDSKILYFVATNKGCNSIFKADILNKTITEISNGKYDFSGISVTKDGNKIVFSRCNMIEPNELYFMSTNGDEITKITKLNDAIIETLLPSSFEEKWIKTKDGKDLHCWIIFPPNFDKNKKYPMITYCQGGPQQMISQAYGYRWNMSLLSAKGYIIVAPNRRGCPGFGQKWIDAITDDWGGKPMQDILDATDAMCKESYVDKNKLVAIGASAGGFTTFWLEGNHNKRFKAFLSHCGVFNFHSMYGATEELFFPDWEWGGPYWENKQNKAFYEKNSPHMFIDKWDTPIIISTGENDFRVPYTQSLEAFTAAQVKGIPSKLLVYPEMNHFIGKTQEYMIWYNEVFDFFEQHLK